MQTQRPERMRPASVAVAAVSLLRHQQHTLTHTLMNGLRLCRCLCRRRRPRLPLFSTTNCRRLQPLIATKLRIEARSTRHMRPTVWPPSPLERMHPYRHTEALPTPNYRPQHHHLCQCCAPHISWMCPAQSAAANYAPVQWVYLPIVAAPSITSSSSSSLSPSPLLVPGVRQTHFPAEIPATDYSRNAAMARHQTIAAMLPLNRAPTPLPTPRLIATGTEVR